MSALLGLRDYQKMAIRALHERWDAGLSRVATVLPTGAGKTVVFSHLAEEFLAANPGKRVLILSHTDELTRQAADKMRAVAPHRTIGIVKAGQNEVHAEVISASVQTLRSARRREQIRNVGLIVVDECHHATATTYRAILEHFGALPDPLRDAEYILGGGSEEIPPSGIPVAGFTATLVRGDKAKLSDVWEEVGLRLSIAFMVRAGYLLDVRGKNIQVAGLDLDHVKTSGGDFQEGALGDALLDALAPEQAAKGYLEHAAGRKGLIFAPTVEAAYAFERAFRDVGITCETVHGALPRDERRAILARLKSGETQVVSNCMVLTEGFDEPSVSCVVIARPTKSAGLYQQMVGRVLRPDLTLKPEDRGDALILNVTGFGANHGLSSLVDLSTRDDLNPEDLSEDLSLLELEEFLADEPEPEEPAGAMPMPAWYAGPVETVEFDPLGADSKRTWGQTPDGTYYLKAGTTHFVFVTPSLAGEPGTHDVVWCERKIRPGQNYAYGELTEHTGLDFQMALAWAEEEALTRGGKGAQTLAGKASRWRREPVSAAALHRAQRAGHFLNARWLEAVTPNDDPFLELNDPARTRRAVHPDGSLITKGEVTDALDSISAENLIDPLVRYVRNCQTPTEG